MAQRLLFSLIILVLMAPGNGAVAQQVDYNKIILPESAKSDDFGEKLVQLAWKNMPYNAVLQTSKEVAELRVTQAKWSWLDQIRATGNLNEFTINPDANPNGNNFFPRYNFGVAIPLGIFISIPTESKIAMKQLKVSEYQINQQKLTVRKSVLSAYQNYLMYSEILKIKTDLVEDEYANLMAMEEKFQKGEVTLEQYKAVSRTYNLEVEEKIQTNNRLQNAKLELELLIGMRLEDVN
jgi:outer membrane protein TolC